MKALKRFSRSSDHKVPLNSRALYSHWAINLSAISPVNTGIFVIGIAIILHFILVLRRKITHFLPILQTNPQKTAYLCCCTNFPPAVKKAKVLRIITRLITDYWLMIIDCLHTDDTEKYGCPQADLFCGNSNFLQLDSNWKKLVRKRTGLGWTRIFVNYP